MSRRSICRAAHKSGPDRGARCSSACAASPHPFPVERRGAPSAGAGIVNAYERHTKAQPSPAPELALNGPAMASAPLSCRHAPGCARGRTRRSGAAPSSPCASSARVKRADSTAAFAAATYATNVLSFAYSDQRRSRATSRSARRWRRARLASAASAARRITRIWWIHGMLHLQGFDHENERDAQRMERLERRILAGLGYADPIEMRNDEC